MAFQEILIQELGPLPPSSKFDSRGTYIQIYTFTQLATDGGGTIATGLSKIDAVLPFGNVEDKAGDVSSTDFTSGGSAVINFNATGGPTAGCIIVIGRK
jgi:hypothetical protein